MSSLQDQFSAATKTNFQSQLELITSLNSKAFENAEKLLVLNMAVFKSAMESSTTNAKHLLSVKDPQEFIALSVELAKPNAEKIRAYRQHVSGIASSAQSDYTHAAEAQIAETKRNVNSLVEDISKNAPAGSENIIAMMKSVISNANSGFEHLSKITKQAVLTMEENAISATAQFAPIAEKTTGHIKK